MNFFELYNIPVDFNVNEKALKKIFYVNSKKYHPDFHTDKTEEEQAKILEFSTLNNEAYKTLKDFDKRMKYILDLKGMLQEGKDKLPQDFLMEMMDINEQLMELQFEPDTPKIDKLIEEISSINDNLYSAVKQILDSYNHEVSKETELSQIKNYYLKRRYIWRIQENLSKFASA